MHKAWYFCTFFPCIHSFIIFECAYILTLRLCGVKSLGIEYINNHLISVKIKFKLLEQPLRGNRTFVNSNKGPPHFSYRGLTLQFLSHLRFHVFPFHALAFAQRFQVWIHVSFPVKIRSRPQKDGLRNIVLLWCKLTVVQLCALWTLKILNKINLPHIYF